MYRRCCVAPQTLEAVAILILIVRQNHPDQEGETSGKFTHSINLIMVINTYNLVVVISFYRGAENCVRIMKRQLKDQMHGVHRYFLKSMTTANTGLDISLSTLLGRYHVNM